MKTIIAGSRWITDYRAIEQAVKLSGFKISEVVSGAAPGVDRAGETFAFVNELPVKRFPADWEKEGNKAGPLRNIQMAIYADALIAIWDGVSRGTAHMVRTAQDRGLKVFVYRVDAGNQQSLL